MAIATPAFADQASVSPRYVPRDLGAHEDLEPARRGLVLEAGVTLVAPSGSIAGDIDAPSFAPGGELRVGYFFSEHLGLLAGASGSFGHRASGCDDPACGGSLISFPLVLEYTLDTPRTGPYLEAGAAIFPRFQLDAPGETLVAWSPLDARAGIGWRFPIADHEAVDLFARADTGVFTNMTDTLAGATSGGVLDPSVTAWHVNFALGAAFELMP